MKTAKLFRNGQSQAVRLPKEFRFKDVPSPSKDDAAARAKLSLVEGEVDPNGADLGALTEREPGPWWTLVWMSVA